MSRTNVQINALINWRRISKIVSESGSETAIRRKSCPEKYLKQIEALQTVVEGWVKEHINKETPTVKYSKEEIKNKLNTIQW